MVLLYKSIEKECTPIILILLPFDDRIDEGQKAN